jgi:mannose-6-phosphate isomerase-like protein (cupin superfamily)
MRKIITGVNAEGQSCIIEVSEVTTESIPEVDFLTLASVYATESSPPPPGPPQTGNFIDTHLDPGMVRWTVFDHLPRDQVDANATSTTMHHSAAVDLVFVLGGSTRLILQADEIDLVPGDCVVMAGVDHAQVNGPEGCRMMSVSIGAPWPASASTQAS